MDEDATDIGVKDIAFARMTAVRRSERIFRLLDYQPNMTRVRGAKSVLYDVEWVNNN